jgi:hypothetical protein
LSADPIGPGGVPFGVRKHIDHEVKEVDADSQENKITIKFSVEIHKGQ